MRPSITLSAKDLRRFETLRIRLNAFADELGLHTNGAAPPRRRRRKAALTATSPTPKPVRARVRQVTKAIASSPE